MSIKEFIAKYGQHNLSTFDYSEILTDIHNSIVGIPFPTVSLYQNELIERIRNDYDGEIFE